MHRVLKPLFLLVVAPAAAAVCRWLRLMQSGEGLSYPPVGNLFIDMKSSGRSFLISKVWFHCGVLSFMGLGFSGCHSAQSNIRIESTKAELKARQSELALLSPTDASGKLRNSAPSPTNTELPPLFHEAAIELTNAVRLAQKVRTETEEAVKKAEAAVKNAEEKVMAARRNQLESESAAQKARAEAKAIAEKIEADKLASPGERLRRAAEAAKIARRQFLFNAVNELRRRGMEVETFEDGRMTNCFMAFALDYKKLIVGGPTTNETVRLEQHNNQFSLLTSIIDRLKAGFESKLRESTQKGVSPALKSFEVNQFKIVPGDHFALVLSEKTLSIWWPPDLIYAPSAANPILNTQNISN